MRVPLAFLVLAASLSCDRPMGPPPGAPMGASRGPSAPAPGAAAAGGTCDRQRCADFCSPARCMFTDDNTEAKCMAVCEANCGNGTFDDQDAAVMTCTINGGHDLSCASPRACCEQQMNTEICAE